MKNSFLLPHCEVPHESLKTQFSDPGLVLIGSSNVGKEVLGSVLGLDRKDDGVPCSNLPNEW